MGRKAMAKLWSSRQWSLRTKKKRKKKVAKVSNIFKNDMVKGGKSFLKLLIV